ncbi:MAG TPA: RNA-binding protein [Thermoanaerobaculia bacterium]|jgi:RNA recognition motif-containing protein|nr:RNA-binding protein [Thermoanaerobaculia bacterium]
MASKVFVGNLDFKATRDQIESVFAEAGEIQDIFIPTDRETGRPRGFAFVEFATPEGAEKAIELFDGHDLGGRSIRVNAAEDRPRRPGGFTPGAPPFEGGRGGGGGGGGGFGGKPKGSRRNLRAKKRSL